ncbi:DUF4350 domain-containing protein [Massilia arenosa]|uniref:DUF4350 domain-containing protein n=1 Tax=Zemynaea arenosa TaxID=2561931 RepID=A0A4Y9SQR0_9BURK|nr:DUF4350 domain-containing protein [Massilia arenosa]TFW27689.1 DUF4350 domain-containing protein [Massilia arenosa]
MRKNPALLIGLLSLAVAGALVALWLHYMERVVEGVPALSEAARENPLLAAQHLLARHGHVLTVTPLLNEQTVSALPARGTLLLQAGVPDPRVAGPLLEWVRRGNTLVMSPMWTMKDAPKSVLPSAERDVIGQRYGASVELRARQDDTCRLDPRREPGARTDDGAPPLPIVAAGPDEEEDEEDAQPETAGGAPAEPAGGAPRASPPPPPPPAHLVCLHIPTLGHPLELSRPNTPLRQADPGAPKPLWSDTYALGVAVFPEGRGHVVMVGQDYFSNFPLRQFDHAELLLAVSGLAGPHAPVLGVQSVEVAHWTIWLWRHYAPFIVSLAVLLTAWLWRQTRRFGPMLPVPPQERRALLEHIDASARWLWRVPGGRELLLTAVRGTTENLLRRRAPALYKLAPAARIRHLAGMCGLPPDAVERALHGPAATRPLDFTHQISTLHQLRRHYER